MEFQRRSSFWRPFSQKKFIRALSNINYEISPNTFHCFFGRNGSGKTTLLRIISGVLLPTKGAVRRNAEKVVYITANERQFQERLTGYENLRFYARLSRDKLSEIIPECERLELSSEIVGQPVWTYTTGMKLKLAVARAFLGSPQVILLDEPTRSIDIAAKKALIAALLEFRQRRDLSIIIAGHDIELASLAESAFVLSRGNILWRGRPTSQSELEKIMENSEEER